MSNSQPPRPAPPFQPPHANSTPSSDSPPQAVPLHPQQPARPIPRAVPLPAQPATAPQPPHAQAGPSQAPHAQAGPLQAQPQLTPNQAQPQRTPNQLHSQPAPPRPVPVQPQQGPAAGPYPAAPAQPAPVQPLPPNPRMAAPRPVTQPYAAPATPAAAEQAPGTHAGSWPGSPQPLRPTPLSAGSPGAPRPVPVSDAAGRLVQADAEDDEEEGAEPTVAVVRNAPPWLISLVIHMVALIVLALLYLPQMFKPQVELEVVYAESLGEQLEDDIFQMTQMEPVEITEPVFSEDLNPVDDPLAAPPNIDVTFDATTASSEIAAPSIGMALSGREKGMKKALLGAYGGTATTEAAVKRGLEWLARNQNADGTWSLTGPYAGGATVENKTAATAMALLAFQGAGNTHRGGEFKQNVARGWNAMLKLQDADGNFFHEGANHHRLYTQAQATIAICELYGMTKDSEYREPAQRAIDYCIRAQSPEGGWRYEPQQDSDTSVTGWFVMALQSAMMAGLEVPSPSLDNISKFLDRASRDDGSRYAYKPGQAETPPMTAEGLLCRQYLGWDRDDPRLLRGVDYVGVHPIDYGDENVYYWYYATQVMHHMEGPHWNRWNRVMREEVPRHQVQTGKERGSWAPENDRWGHHGGRLFTTCLSIYMLEVYYRHLPIYKYKLQ